MSNVCEHGQLARTCLLCEMRDENLTLKREGLEALQEWAETEARLEAEIKNLRSQLAEQSALVSSAIVSAAFATGHGDSVIDMVNELIGQAESLRTQLADCRADAGRWRPIETAPKDGTEIILCRDDRVTSGCWTEWTETVAEYHATTGAYLGRSIQDSGEYWSSWDGGFVEEKPPTAWQSLPAPPAIAAREGA